MKLNDTEIESTKCHRILAKNVILQFNAGSAFYIFS